MKAAAIPACVTTVLCLGWLSACGGKSSPTSPSQNCVPLGGRSTITLGAGDVFRLRFRAAPAMTRDVVMLTYMGLPEAGFRSSRISHRLYDGDRLLGTQDNTETIAVWKSPESAFGTPGDTTYGMIMPVTAVDYTAIVNGTFDGRLDLVVLSGSVEISSADLAEVQLYGPIRAPFPERIAPRTGLEWCR